MSVRSLISLARPRGALLISCLPLVGFGYGLWERGSQIHPRFVLLPVLTLFVAWVFGHAGAMWLNAELDRDEGEVLFGEAVAVPPGTGVAGYLALVLSVATASLVGLPTALCAGLCAVLAVLYSHPKVALKARAVGGPLVNGVGYGSLSPIGGWLASEPVPTWRAAIVILLAMLFILGVYFSAQAFQQDEDAERGYRTLVVTHGPRFTLQMARLCLVGSASGAVLLSVSGAFPRGLLVAVPFWIWMDRHLAAWVDKPKGGSGADATHLVKIVTYAVLAMLISAYAHQAYAIWHRLPAGGCDTAIVPAALAAACG